MKKKNVLIESVRETAKTRKRGDGKRESREKRRNAGGMRHVCSDVFWLCTGRVRSGFEYAKLETSELCFEW